MSDMICQAAWLDFRSSPSRGLFIGLRRPQCRVSLSILLTISPLLLSPRPTLVALLTRSHLLSVSYSSYIRIMSPRSHIPTPA
ncbi:hypothetical protein LZ31DRAFT_550760 [Colletotrichum somersetense]|nr:hypothetical protein LZ31DRAFT_550760 [Colletotrichum somersetense]